MRTRLLVLIAAAALAACAVAQADPAAQAPPAAARQARRAELQPKVEQFLNEVIAPGSVARLP